MADTRENRATTWISDGFQTTALDKRDGREPLRQRRDITSERQYCFSLLGTPFLKNSFFAGSLLLFHKIGLWLKLESKGLRNKRLFSLPAKRLSFGAYRVDAGKHCDFVLFCSCRLSERCQRPRSRPSVACRAWRCVVLGNGCLKPNFPFLGSKGENEYLSTFVNSRSSKHRTLTFVHRGQYMILSSQYCRGGTIFLGGTSIVPSLLVSKLWANCALGHTAGKWWGL